MGTKYAYDKDTLTNICDILETQAFIGVDCSIHFQVVFFMGVSIFFLWELSKWGVARADSRRDGPSNIRCIKTPLAQQTPQKLLTQLFHQAKITTKIYTHTDIQVITYCKLD